MDVYFSAQLSSVQIIRNSDLGMTRIHKYKWDIKIIGAIANLIQSIVIYEIHKWKNSHSFRLSPYIELFIQNTQSDL